MASQLLRCATRSILDNIKTEPRTVLNITCSIWTKSYNPSQVTRKPLHPHTSESERSCHTRKKRDRPLHVRERRMLMPLDWLNRWQIAEATSARGE